LTAPTDSAGSIDHKEHKAHEETQRAALFVSFVILVALLDGAIRWADRLRGNGNPAAVQSEHPPFYRS
jgi:hypothetical protein